MESREGGEQSSAAPAPPPVLLEMEAAFPPPCALRCVYLGVVRTPTCPAAQDLVKFKESPR